jgi:hypothetical protein
MNALHIHPTVVILSCDLLCGLGSTLGGCLASSDTTLQRTIQRRSSHVVTGDEESHWEILASESIAGSATIDASRGWSLVLRWLSIWNLK